MRVRDNILREETLQSSHVSLLSGIDRRSPSVSALLAQRAGRPLGVHLLGDEVETVIQNLIDSYYLKRERPRVIGLYIGKLPLYAEAKISPFLLTKRCGGERAPLIPPSLGCPVSRSASPAFRSFIRALDLSMNSDLLILLTCKNCSKTNGHRPAFTS
jgi:hypothetical protein